MYAALVTILGIMILTVVVIIASHVQSMKVEGLKYNSEQEVIRWIKKDEASVNSLYLFWKYNMQKPELLPYMESLEIKFKVPWAVSVEVREKKIVGFIKKNGEHYFFDKEGFVVLVSDTPVDGVPKIDGMKVEGAGLYKKLKTADEDVFEHILEVTQLLKQEELQPDRVLSDGKNVTLHFGEITVELGSSGYSHKIVQLPVVLEKLSGEAGVLRMKYYNKDSKYISFRKDNPDAEPEDGEDGEPEDDEDENSEDESLSDEDNIDKNDDDGEDWSDSSDEEDDTEDDEEESSTSLDYGDDIDSSVSGYEEDDDEDSGDWE